MNQIQNKNNIKITQKDLQEIYGKDWKFFQEKIIPNCYCHTCKGPYNATIIDYEISLNDINDVILKGKCKKCGNPVNRYLETGEVYDYAIEDIRRYYKKIS